MNIYTVTFTIKAFGGSTTTAEFEFEIECGFPIREYPEESKTYDPVMNPITVYYPIKKNQGFGEYTIDAYKHTGGDCNIYRYLIDNDDDRATPFKSITGIEDQVLSVPSLQLPCDNTTLSRSKPCRTIQFDQTKISYYVLWIHIQG